MVCEAAGPVWADEPDNTGRIDARTSARHIFLDSTPSKDRLKLDLVLKGFSLGLG